MITWTLDYVRMRCTECGDCWLWNDSLVNGYAQATINGKGGQLVRRFVFQSLMGKELRKGRMVSSRCGNKRCVSPNCLIGITRGEVMTRAYASGARCVTTEYKQRVRNLQKSGRTILDYDKAEEIRRKSQEGISSRKLALEYGVSSGHIRKLMRGDGWRQQVSGASVFTWRP